MKKRLFLKAVLASIVILFLVAPSAMGYQVDVYRMNGYYTGAGGEFTLKPSADFSWILSSYYPFSTYDFGSQVFGFETFCIETGETVNPNGSTYNANIQPNAVNGGVGPAGDPVSIGTAWLYNHFVLGTLTGYNYTAGLNRETSAGQLQNALWYLEGEITLVSPLSNSYLALVNTQFGSLATAMENNDSNIYPVYALHLEQTSGCDPRAQDMLVRYVTTVPEPSTLLLLGAALLGLAGLRRRMD